MPVEIRPITADHTADFLRAMSTPFAFDLDEDEEAEVSRFLEFFEPERARCAFEGHRMVGTLGSFSFAMTVPGGEVPCAGTTMVTVQPTHRRRGILRFLIGAHFDDARERGEPIAALYASDSAIYGRFGYGLASLDARMEIGRPHVQLHRLAADPYPVRAVTADEAEAVFPPLFDRLRAGRPGMFRRTPGWWNARRFHDPPRHREGFTAQRLVVADGPDGPAGYVQYRLKEGWVDHHGAHTVRVREIVALDPGAAAGLWQLVLNHDLASKVELYGLAVDDPVFDLMAGWRRAAPTLVDQLWVRILDVPAALAARRYAVDGSVSFAVHDPWTGATSTHRLTVEDGVGECLPADGHPDVGLDIEDLGACYLGRSRFRALGRAGRVTGTPEALAAADALFGWDPAPWCQEVF